MSSDNQASDDWMIDVMGRDHPSTEEEEEIMWRKQSIYRIPSFIKDRNKCTYDPMLVSIGPYHHGEPHLMPMEAHKRRALRHFLARSRKPLEYFVDGMKREEKELRDSYEYLDEKWCDSNIFIELIITDGCFILEFMDTISGTPKDYSYNDPIFSYYGSIIHYNFVMRDLLLLENQLPYLALKKLLTLAEVRQEFPGENVDETFLQMMMFPSTTGTGSHMLDFYMKGLFHGRSKDSKDDPDIEETPSASQLNRVGVKFNKISSFADIKFDGGTLDLPTLDINDYTVSTFLNLKAFELRGTTRRDFNSYICLMTKLLQSVKDVALLKEAKIIVNYLDSDEQVVRLMKELAKDAVLDRDCNLSKAQTDMTRHYYESMKHWRNEFKMVLAEWFSYLKQNYFRNPWSAISVVAAAVLLGLTVIQTVYSVKSYAKQKSN
ncbi:hypothetical protein Scep_021463 [Stephania cephalantha]|uniref:Uncharacterized protein n=1 Tax=Stephania cephalantha TaxID=152367 RepID=A0AAP0FDT1_9MAGN